MKNKTLNRKIFIIPLILVIGVLGTYWGYHYLNLSSEQTLQEKANLPDEADGPLEEEAQFNEGASEFKNVGDFIAEYHEWYNQKLGWGGLKAVSWIDQQKAASELQAELALIETDHADLQKDFNSIAGYAEQVASGEKDAKLLQSLHRYFHDLDIEYNGYRDTNDYYEITEFKRDR